jgi:hypothetical protein
VKGIHVWYVMSITLPLLSGAGAAILVAAFGGPRKRAIGTAIAVVVASGLASFLLLAVGLGCNAENGPDYYEFSPYEKFCGVADGASSRLYVVLVLVPSLLLTAGSLMSLRRASFFGFVAYVAALAALAAPVALAAALPRYEYGVYPVFHDGKLVTRFALSRPATACFSYGIETVDFRVGSQPALCVEFVRRARAVELARNDEATLALFELEEHLTTSGVKPYETPGGDVGVDRLRITNARWLEAGATY